MKTISDVQNCNIRFSTAKVEQHDIGKVLLNFNSNSLHVITSSDVDKTVSTLQINNKIMSTIFVDNV